MVFLARNVVRGRKLLTENVEFYEEYRMDPSTETCTRTRNSAALDALMEELKEAYQFLGMGYTPLQRHKENNDKTMFLEMQAHKRKKSKVDDVADDENARAYQEYMRKSLFVTTEVLKIISFLGQRTPYNVTDSTFDGAKIYHSLMNTVQVLRDLRETILVQAYAEKQMVELDSDPDYGPADLCRSNAPIVSILTSCKRLAQSIVACLESNAKLLEKSVDNFECKSGESFVNFVLGNLRLNPLSNQQLESLRVANAKIRDNINKATLLKEKVLSETIAERASKRKYDAIVKQVKRLKERKPKISEKQLNLYLEEKGLSAKGIKAVKDALSARKTKASIHDGEDNDEREQEDEDVDQDEDGDNEEQENDYQDGDDQQEEGDRQHDDHDDGGQQEEDDQEDEDQDTNSGGYNDGDQDQQYDDHDEGGQQEEDGQEDEDQDTNSGGYNDGDEDGQQEEDDQEDEGQDTDSGDNNDDDEGDQNGQEQRKRRRLLSRMRKPFTVDDLEKLMEKHPNENEADIRKYLKTKERLSNDEIDKLKNALFLRERSKIVNEVEKFVKMHPGSNMEVVALYLKQTEKLDDGEVKDVLAEVKRRQQVEKKKLDSQKVKKSQSVKQSQTLTKDDKLNVEKAEQEAQEEVDNELTASCAFDRKIEPYLCGTTRKINLYDALNVFRVPLKILGLKKIDPKYFSYEVVDHCGSLEQLLTLTMVTEDKMKLLVGKLDCVTTKINKRMCQNFACKGPIHLFGKSKLINAEILLKSKGKVIAILSVRSKGATFIVEKIKKAGGNDNWKFKDFNDRRLWIKNSMSC